MLLAWSLVSPGEPVAVPREGVGGLEAPVQPEAVSPHDRSIPMPLDPLTVTADEPRFVAPTRRDRIGRIWAPVSINGQGPFRLVLDTGASHSAITADVAARLGISLETDHKVLLRGATGSATVPLVPIETLEVGDLLMEPKRLPIVPDALGGAEGILGSDGLANKRIHIDFRRDQISIKRSLGEKAASDFITIPFKFMRGRLLVVEATMGGVRTKAIIDTGGQATIGNNALRDALAERRRRFELEDDLITGATLDVQPGSRGITPAIYLGGVLVRNNAMTFADLVIFKHWKLIEEPTMLVGMDLLGLLDVLVIDYRRKELQVKLRRG